MKLTGDKPTKKVWNFKEGDVIVEISLHAEGEWRTPMFGGIWCYYLCVHERYTPEKFDTLWLEEQVNSHGRIEHDYNSLPCLETVDFHGGITYYSKYGHNKGHRSVKLGCDFNHAFDHNNPPDFESVLRSAINAARQLHKWLHEDIDNSPNKTKTKTKA